VTLNKNIQSLIKEIIQIEVSGKKLLKGTLIDLGTDIMVIFNGVDYVYISFNHIHQLNVVQKTELDITSLTEFPINTKGDTNEDISLEEVLKRAKGKNSEIYIDNQALHGCITRTMGDYFEFYSPIYKTMYISIKHLKWLIPYAQNESPYGLNDNYSKQLDLEPLAETFEEQIGKFKDKMIVLNIGGSKSHIGRVKSVEDQIVEMQKARTTKEYLNIGHIKTIHQV